MTTRELRHLLRRLAGLRILSADGVEVAPADDHAELTALAAATVVYKLTTVFACRHKAPRSAPAPGT